MVPFFDSQRNEKTQIKITGSLPSPLDEAIKFLPIGNTYLPIFLFNDYWNLAADFLPINNSVTELNFTLTFAPLSLFKWQLYASQQVSYVQTTTFYCRRLFIIFIYYIQGFIIFKALLYYIFYSYYLRPF